VSQRKQERKLKGEESSAIQKDPAPQCDFDPSKLGPPPASQAPKPVPGGGAEGVDEDTSAGQIEFATLMVLATENCVKTLHEEAEASELTFKEKLALAKKAAGETDETASATSSPAITSLVDEHEQDRRTAADRIAQMTRDAEAAKHNIGQLLERFRSGDCVIVPVELRHLIGTDALIKTTTTSDYLADAEARWKKAGAVQSEPETESEPESEPVQAAANVTPAMNHPSLEGLGPIKAPAGLEKMIGSGRPREGIDNSRLRRLRMECSKGKIVVTPRGTAAIVTTSPSGGQAHDHEERGRADDKVNLVFADGTQIGPIHVAKLRAATGAEQARFIREQEEFITNSKTGGFWKVVVGMVAVVLAPFTVTAGAAAIVVGGGGIAGAVLAELSD
jgi:hypothetical protein